MLTLKLKLAALSVLALTHALVPRQVSQPCGALSDLCDGRCRDLANDAQHCGRCNLSCDGDGLSKEAYCLNGRCMCPGGPACSYGNIVFCPDFKTAKDHCGRCDNRCAETHICVDSTCTPCPQGQISCYSGAVGKCIDVTSDNKNCGGCGQMCDTAAGATCTGGECVCPSPNVTCGQINTSCVNLQTDRSNCGACYHTCDYKCENGKCVDCPEGLGGCYGECKNFANDNFNCGRCNNWCDEGQNCVEGVCTGGPGGCPSGQLRCEGECFNAQNDNRHCGACNNKCDAGKNCAAGKCV